MKKLLPLLLVALAVFALGSCSQPFAGAVINEGEAKALQIGEGKEIIAYFCDWSVYGGHDQYRANLIPFDKLTIINFSFCSIVDNTHTLFDGFKQFTQEKFNRTVQKYEVAWLDANADVNQAYGLPSVPWDNEYKGVLGQLRYYKEQYPHLKVLPSVGGWTKGHMFSEMAANPASRAVFVQSAVTFAREYHMDGVDIDWEYPGISREADTRDPHDWGCPGQPADVQNFTILMKELREAFDAAGVEDNKEYMVTAAMGIGYDKFAMTEVDKYPQYLDYINLMTYDMHGSWDAVAGHQAPIHVPTNAPYDADIRDKYNVDYAIQQFLDAGVPASKLTLGMPFYSRGWKGVPVGDDANLPGLYETTTGSPVGKWDNPSTPGGQNPYFLIKDKIAAGSLKAYHDPVADASYAYGNGEFYTFDTIDIIRKKSQMVMDMGLGGAMIWEIDGDTWKDGTYELTNAIFDVLYKGPQPTPTATATHNPDWTPTPTFTPTATFTPTNTPTATPTTDPNACQEPDYVPGQTYTTEIVCHNGRHWKAQWWTTAEPGTTGQWGAWKDMGPCPEVTPATPTATATNVVVTPTATATDVVVTPTPTATDVVVTPTPTATDVVVTPTPTATQGTGPADWAAGVSYKAGDLVSYNGVVYECRQPHTSLPGWEPANVASLWLAK